MGLKNSAEKLYSKLEGEILLIDLCKYSKFKSEGGDQEDFNFNVKYYKKRRVYPALNKDGKINWFNFVTGGSWFKLTGTIIIILIILGCIFEYSSNLKIGADCITRENLVKNLSNLSNLIK